MNKHSTSVIEKLLLEYQNYLIQTAGHRPSTCKSWIFYARVFLRHQFKGRFRKLPWARIKAVTLLRFFLRERKTGSVSRVKLMATGLRSFCRFLRLKNYCAQDWSLGIPRLSSGGREGLPSYLSQEQLARLLSPPKTFGTNVRRDFAVIVCLARLGLRAGEAAGLALEDINWSEGILSLARGKGRHPRQFPLPKTVGQALAEYLRKERPASEDRHLFLFSGGQKALSPEAVSDIASKSLKALGLACGGSHVLRRTVASHLVQKGAGIKEVADLLGHKNLATTMVYAQVNLPMLQEAARPWPEEAGQ